RTPRVFLESQGPISLDHRVLFIQTRLLEPTDFREYQACRPEERLSPRDHLQEVGSLDGLTSVRADEHESLCVRRLEKCQIERPRGLGVRLEEVFDRFACFSHGSQPFSQGEETIAIGRRGPLPLRGWIRSE